MITLDEASRRDRLRKALRARIYRRTIQRLTGSKEQAAKEICKEWDIWCDEQNKKENNNESSTNKIS